VPPLILRALADSPDAHETAPEAGFPDGRLRSGNQLPGSAGRGADTRQLRRHARPPGDNLDLQYEVRRRGNDSQFCLTRQGHELITASDEGELLFILERS
jgi:hypothetical protein